MKKTALKINIEDYLYAIDTAFSGKTQKDIYLIYVMIFSGIFAFAYLFFWDSSVTEFEETRTNVVKLQNQIKTDNRFLQSNPESKIAQLDVEIKKINEQIIVNKDNNAYIKNKIETISSLIHDKRTWDKYLDSISENAQRYNVKIKSFTNKHISNDKHFGHVLDITISSSASYKNTLCFINSLEQSQLVVDIHKLSIKAEKKLNTDLNISVWGITY